MYICMYICVQLVVVFACVCVKGSNKGKTID